MTKFIEGSEKSKSFSPYTRRKLNKVLEGIDLEYLHDIFRLILRPNNQSANHWLRDTKTRLKDALHTKMDVTNRDLYLLYAFITDRGSCNSDLKLDEGSIEIQMEKVSYEKYGPYINNDVKLCKKLIQSLHDKMNPRKDYTKEEVNKLVDDWYKSIPKK